LKTKRIFFVANRLYDFGCSLCPKSFLTGTIGQDGIPRVYRTISEAQERDPKPKYIFHIETADAYACMKKRIFRLFSMS
jgi:hypothetical protein